MRKCCKTVEKTNNSEAKDFYNIAVLCKNCKINKIINTFKSPLLNVNYNKIKNLCQS